MTSIGRIRAFGAAPACPGVEPAAMLATNVPWPRPSPGEFGVRLVRVTCGSTRPPPSKSARVASIPESTIAIVPVAGPGLAGVPQSFATPDSYGHISFEYGATVPLSLIGASAVIVRPGFLAISFRRAAGTSTAAAPIRSSCFRTLPSPRTLAAAEPVPAELSMIRCSFWPGFFSAWSSSPGATNVGAFDFPPLSALAPSGITIVIAATTASTAARPPRPQSAFARAFPLRPDISFARVWSPRPQSAFARVSFRFLGFTFLPLPCRRAAPARSAVPRRNLVTSSRCDVTQTGQRAKFPRSRERPRGADVPRSAAAEAAALRVVALGHDGCSVVSVFVGLEDALVVDRGRVLRLGLGVVEACFPWVDRRVVAHVVFVAGEHAHVARRERRGVEIDGRLLLTAALPPVPLRVLRLGRGLRLVCGRRGRFRFGLGLCFGCREGLRLVFGRRVRAGLGPGLRVGDGGLDRRLGLVGRRGVVLARRVRLRRVLG